MKMDDDDFKCIVCDKQKHVLISVNIDADTYELFSRRRGICQDCIKTTDDEAGIHFVKMEDCNEKIQEFFQLSKNRFGKGVETTFDHIITRHIMCPVCRTITLHIISVG
jgi:hypothetical protein